MHVGFDGVSHLVIDDQADVLNVDTSSCEIGSNEHGCISIAKGSECGFSLILSLAGVQSRWGPLGSFNSSATILRL